MVESQKVDVPPAPEAKPEVAPAAEEEKKGPVQVKPICLIMGYMLDIIEKKDL